jgi:hypothetical protein
MMTENDLIALATATLKQLEHQPLGSPLNWNGNADATANDEITTLQSLSKCDGNSFM